MPRSHPPKTITLLLPSTSPSAADQRYSTLALEPKPPIESSDPPSLEVLLLAEKLAKRRGHQFDIESFMTPLQRHQYRAMRSESIHSPPPSDDGGDASGGLSEVTLGKRPSMGEGEDPLPGPSTPNGTSLSLPSTPVSAADSPVFKKPRLMPNLSHLHWKVRQKKLKELALQDGLPGLPNGFSGYPTTPIDSNTSAQPVSIAGSTGVNIVTGGRGGNVDKAGIQASVSYWNHLLIQARKDRGPQWDYNSQTYQIDRSTKDYYSHMTSPPLDPVKLPPEAKVEVDQPATSTTINLSSLRRASASAPSSEERKSVSAGTPGIAPPEAYHLQNPLPPGPQRGRRPSLTPQTTPQDAFPSPAGSTAALGQSGDGAGGPGAGMPKQPGQPNPGQGQGNFQRRPSMSGNPSQQVQLPNRPPPVTATAAGPPGGMAGPPSMSFMGYQQPGPGYNPTLPTQPHQTQQFQQARPMGPPVMPGMQGMQGMNMTPAMLANIRASMQQGQGMGQAMGMAQGQMGQGQGMGMGMGQMGQMGMGMGMNMSGMGGMGMGGMNMGQMGQMGMGMNPLGMGMGGMAMGPPGGGGINPAALGMGRPGMPQPQSQPQPQTASAGQGPMLGGGSNWDFNS